MHTTVATQEVRIATAAGWLQGDLVLPEGFDALVLFADVAGRHSAANRGAARHLHQHRIATLLLELLTPSEQQSEPHGGQHHFDVPLLTGRLQEATLWLEQESALRHAAIGYFAAGSGATAAVIAAARLGLRVAAVVARGGRPDQAGSAALAALKAPTLLIVDGRNAESLAHHEAAYQHLGGEHSLAVVPGVESSDEAAMEQAAQMAADWFGSHFAALRQTTTAVGKSRESGHEPGAAASVS